MAKYSRLLIVILILGAVSQGYAQQKKIIYGHAVARSGLPVCFGRIAYADVLVERAGQEPTEPKLVVIRTSHPCAPWQEWVNSLNSRNQFRVYYGEATVTTIQKYADDKDTTPEQSDGAEIGKFPIWTKLPGHESFQLPYGTSVPTYESADWPVVPLM